MPAAPVLPHTSNALQRYRNRHAFLVKHGFTYYPKQAIYVELVSVGVDEAGKHYFLPRNREVYAREVMEVPDVLWRAYLMGTGRGLIEAFTIVDAWRGHPVWAKKPCDALIDPDAFAVDRDGNHSRALA